MAIFQAAQILLPRTTAPEKWAVIACDQFASEPAYWQHVRQQVGNAPSTLHLIWPEAELQDDPQTRIAAINAAMRQYLANDYFQKYDQCFIFVERVLSNGQIRRGIVGMLDLESYDYAPDTQCPVRATEKTVVERIPPRVNIRKDAPLELPHVLLLCDDPTQSIFQSLDIQSLPVVYDFELMEGGGRITGRLIQGSHALALQTAIAQYESREKPVLYAVGDGNHSLAAAKACYAQNPTPTSRYALVELENIHDPSQQFEPIHRIITDTDPAHMLSRLPQAEDGYPLRWVSGDQSGTVKLQLAPGQLPVGALQNFLDGYLSSHPGNIDYIHGEDSLLTLSRQKNAIGFFLPSMEKSQLFPGILADGVLPRKTFSMGHAREKRYYLEARLIRAIEGVSK